ncbi:MAG TPA: 3-oxo-5-alpha-steroid 4-dehydrogenase [Bacteroidales bacterium]|nr:3-oxo-5-alpha-steroid 4-dehydrogenase [Bacteroidales bacterium]
MKSDLHNLLVLVPAILWISHYFHRVVIYPLQIRTKGKKIPLVITGFAFLFNIINGCLNGYWFATFAPGNIPGSLTIIRLTAGTILFISGFIINKYHDYLLINLRSVNEKGYSIPYGGLFQYVSCPNFLGEIISWTGFTLAVFSLPALSFLVWTCVNLITRALDHHKWYIEKFTGYPKERKAIFPFLL